MPKINDKKPCSVCGRDSVAKGLCAKHYSLLRNNGDTETVRSIDWGMRTSHPLYDTWRNTIRVSQGRVERWNNFWNFVSDVGERPTEQHRLVRRDNSMPFSPGNCYWLLSVGSSTSGKAYQKAWRKNNPLKSKSNDLKKSYGITLNEFEELIAKQDNKCAICGKEETTIIKGKRIRLAVDHCHTTNEVRGLLCRNCNKGLGLFFDNVELLKNAINYLSQHNAKPKKQSSLEIPELIAVSTAVNFQVIEQQDEPDVIIPSAPKKEPAPVRLCDVEGCNNIHSAQGFCRKHYKRLLAGHNPHETAKRTCKQCGCSLENTKSLTAEYCSQSCKMKWSRANGCYSKEREHEREKCSIEECNNPRQAQGLCRRHYMIEWHKNNPKKQ